MKKHSILKMSCKLPFIKEAAGALLLLLFAAGVVEAGNPGPKVVILELHGMKQGVISENLDPLPHFKEMVRGADDELGYVYFPRVRTTIPAASQPAVTSMYTGLYPGRTGVVSTIWLDRRTAGVHTLISYSQQRINRILASNGVKSLFDLARDAGKRSMTTMLMLTKGADWSIRSRAPFWGNSSVLGLFRNGRLIPDSRYVDERTMRAFLNGHISSFKESLEGIRKDYGTIPDVSAVQLLGTDLFSHYPFEEPRKWHVSMDNIQKYYARAVLDPLVGELTSSLKRMGSYENTIFAIVSDHGFTPIARLIRNEIFGESLELQFHLPSWRRTNRQADAVIMPGAGTKEIYLKNRRSEEWIDPPRLLADVKVAVDLLLDNPEVLECMGELLIRQYPGERHEGVTEDDTWWVFDWRGYPGGASRDDQAFLSALRPLSALASRFELGEYIVQGVRNQYTRQTAPDIQLITKKGSYFENDTDKYGHHGSYYPDDCTVSFWLCGPGLARVAPGRHVIDRTISTLDLVPMVTRLLGIPIPAGLDGVDPLAEIAEIKEGITGPWKPAATVPNSPSGPMTGSR